MADPAIVREWLDKADEDFGFAESCMRQESTFYPQVCFHFQQAAEKYLKAFIIAKGLAFSKVHDLVHLLRICSAQSLAFSGLEEDCVLLNTAYIETRYPVHWPTNYTRESAEQAFISAERIAKVVRSQLHL
jgi:HEPN domain-containing protein